MYVDYSDDVGSPIFRFDLGSKTGNSTVARWYWKARELGKELESIRKKRAAAAALPPRT